jgi:hypothetical protein
VTIESISSRGYTLHVHISWQYTRRFIMLLSLFLSPHTHTQVGNAKKCTAASMLLMEKHRIYVQDINYPTVVRGKEKLRIAPTPFHTPEMQEKFVASVVDVWQELGLDFLEPNLKECRGHAPMHGFLGNVQLAA